VTKDIGTEVGNIELIHSAEDAFGPIDLFFANAGVGTGGDPMTPDEEWNTAFDINVHAHRWAARHLVPGWLARGEGYFCSTASAAGLLAQIGSAPYSVTKHAAVAFAEWMSITYGDRGIRVSCLCPQGVNTAMLTGGDADVGGGAGSGLGGDVGGNVVRLAGDVLEPDDVAAVVHEAIRVERFLILPHQEVAEYMRRKATDPDRWLAGMRKLQRRVLGEQA
jgi:NAD(P)-dependent dehydrogenase (short-subunit alcohol dehydrogenase family)